MTGDPGGYEEAVREELAAHREHLRASEFGDSFSDRLSRSQLEDRIAALEEELAAVADERLVLRFEDAVGRHSLPTKTLGYLLSRLQSALTYTGWALHAGPGIEGRPPAQIARSTSTEVLALAPGSFEVAISPSTLEIPTDETGEDLLDQAIGMILDFVAAASRDRFGDEVEEWAEELGREPSRRLALWFNKIADRGLDTTFEWSVRPEASARLTSGQARDLGRWLSDVEERWSEVTVEGTLRVADTIRKRFAIEDDKGSVYEGKAAPELMDRGVIGTRYSARLQVRTREAEHTGAVRRDYSLLTLEARV